MSDGPTIENRTIDRGNLRLLPERPSEHAISAEYLAKVVSGLQAALYAIGAQHSDPDIVHPAKNQDVREHFQLVVLTPRPGSVLLPVEVRDTRQSTSFDDIMSTDRILSDAAALLQSVESKDYSTVQKLLPSPVLRRRALKDIQKTLPKSSEQWAWELGTQSSNVRVTESFGDTIEDWLARREEAVEMAVIGQLIRFDFEARLITLKHPATGRKLSAVYDAAREDALLQQRLQLIQVEGDVLLDSNGHAAEIVHVRSTRAIDLAPVVIAEVSLEGSTLQANPKLELVPRLDSDTSQLYEAVDDALGIDAYGHTREELISAIEDDVRFLWKAYAT
ncbi:MAG: hypothetical protein KJ747_00925 [Actinobacteria bacterium]|nr:hypothetical protein [Actinomycetota bacterium]